MNQIKTLNSKLLNTKIPTGWIEEDFADYLGISKEKFLEKLNATFSSKAVRDFKHRMDKNRKRREKNQPSSKSETEVETGAGTNSVPVESITTVEPTSVEENPLDEKLQEEEELIKVIVQKENEHSELLSKKLSLKIKLSEAAKYLENIRAELAQKAQEVDSITQKLSSIDLRVSELNSELTNFRRDLVSVKEQISKLKKFTVFVYDDNFEFENSEVIEIPASWEELFSKLIDSSSTEDLKVKQLRQLAKTIVLFNELQDNGNTFELFFDSETMQEAFEKITDGKDS